MPHLSLSELIPARATQIERVAGQVGTGMPNLARVHFLAKEGPITESQSQF